MVYRFQFLLSFTGMARAADILQLSADIVQLFNPHRVILFGSYAYGTPTVDSDVDLLVVMPHEMPASRTATRIRLGVNPTFPMDLLVRTAAELTKGAAEKDWFIVEVLEKGIVLHDHTNRAMGAKGRSRLRRRLAAAPVAQSQPV